jgi:hypothetical protein
MLPAGRVQNASVEVIAYLPVMAISFNVGTIYRFITGPVLTPGIDVVGIFTPITMIALPRHVMP